MKVTIPKGKRYPRIWTRIALLFRYGFLVHVGRALRVRVRFAHSCAQAEAKPQALNKLFGRSHGLRGSRYGFLDRFNALHGESDRVCWEPTEDGDAVSLYAYPYRAGVRPFDAERSRFGTGWLDRLHLCDVLVEREYDVVLEFGAYATCYAVYDARTGELLCNRLIRRERGPRRWGLLGYPYFGGRAEAPHDVTMEVARV